MLTHLDDPHPPVPGPEQRAAVARRVSRLRLRRRAFAASTAALVVMAGAVTATALWTGRPPSTEVAVGKSGRHATTRLPRRPGPAQSRTPATPEVRRDPAVIAVVQGQHLEVLDATTGKVVHDLLGSVGAISLSPSGRQVYAERTNGHLDPFPIDRIPTAGGPAEQIATGQQPAISPDGTRLAYEAGNGHALTIQTLATGRRHTIDLAALIGTDASFNNTPNSTLVWLSNHQLVAIPGVDATTTPTSATSIAPPAGPPRTCSALYSQRRQCAIVIDLDATHPAHLVTLDVPRDYTIETAGPGPVSGQLLVGGGEPGPNVLRFRVTDTAATRTGSTTIPGQPLVVGFSPSGRHVLYLRGHGPVQLWSGRLTHTSVTPTVELVRNADLGTVSW